MSNFMQVLHLSVYLRNYMKKSARLFANLNCGRGPIIWVPPEDIVHSRWLAYDNGSIVTWFAHAHCRRFCVINYSIK